MANELDELFCVRPDGFTARRTELAQAAKRRGEPSVAKQILAARKPNTAAWVVNRLVRENNEARSRLSDLGARLRAAHADLDGGRIRLLSAEQRSLVEELTREAFARADVKDPPFALRDDVSGTFQAAIADPDVTVRLGRLTKAERWSGFGQIGDAATVDAESGHATTTRKGAAHTAADDDARQGESLRAAVAKADQVVTEADHAMSMRQEELAVAQACREQARERLNDAERAVNDAEAAYRKSRQALRDAAATLKDAKARLSQEV